MAIKNTLLDLNNHLFEQLERLNDESLNDKELEKEMKRAKAMTQIASSIVHNASVALDAEKLKAEYGSRNVAVPTMIQENQGVRMHGNKFINK